jgi:hypothetical protein
MKIADGMMRKVFHWMAHVLGWNEGLVETWWEGSHLMVGFRCSGCGRLLGISETRMTIGTRR